MKFANFLTSLNQICTSIVMYMIGYVIKMSAFFSGVLLHIIPNPYPRLIGSVLISFSISQVLISVSTNLKGKPWVSISLAVFDAFLLMLVLDAFNTELSIIERIKRVFIACFLSFMFYQLIEVFKAKKSEEEAKLQQLKTTQEQQKADIERLKAFECEFCGKPHTSLNAKNAHVGRCKSNPKNKPSEVLE